MTIEMLFARRRGRPILNPRGGKIRTIIMNHKIHVQESGACISRFDAGNGEVARVWEKSFRKRFLLKGQ